MFTGAELEAAAAAVHRQMGPTPLLRWPLLDARLGTPVRVKHENHAPTGAFKVRGAITYIDWLRRTDPACRGIVTATRGNHGQAQARAARAAGLRVVIHVPEGNAAGKNAAMAAYGAELRIGGADYDAAREAAMATAAAEGLHFVPPFHPELVRGVATYGWEMFRADPALDVVYVPVGCGSGLCGVIAARDALAPGCAVVGVVAEGAPTVRLSVEAGRLIPTDAAQTFADGIAVRVPVQAAFDIYRHGAARFVTVSDAEIAAAIRAFFHDTHNLAEGAGAAALAAAMQEAAAIRGRRVGVVLCGGNIDWPVFRTVMEGGMPDAQPPSGYSASAS